jgi:DNA-directed RNA polymerase specialized sigma24 family protein
MSLPTTTDLITAIDSGLEPAAIVRTIARPYAEEALEAWSHTIAAKARREREEVRAEVGLTICETIDQLVANPVRLASIESLPAYLYAAALKHCRAAQRDEPVAAFGEGQKLGRALAGVAKARADLIAEGVEQPTEDAVLDRFNALAIASHMKQLTAAELHLTIAHIDDADDDAFGYDHSDETDALEATQQLVSACLAVLTPAEREAFVLQKVDGLSVPAIAQRIGAASLRSTERLLARAKGKAAAVAVELRAEYGFYDETTKVGAPLQLLPCRPLYHPIGRPPLRNIGKSPLGDDFICSPLSPRHIVQRGLVPDEQVGRNSPAEIPTGVRVDGILQVPSPDPRPVDR